ncbi:hypothetical protein RISK_001694 [Rhodopirellula islandica]|uniref:Uncharacterized protein n=1 Tax=Rhodopirellula islandica TaxID=595434 RepID=A0A0J1BJ75_RHOIS|nr:hypothetical protein RISK_001694 [Rhodopirellula islandica]
MAGFGCFCWNASAFLATAATVSRRRPGSTWLGDRTEPHELADEWQIVSLCSKASAWLPGETWPTRMHVAGFASFCWNASAFLATAATVSRRRPGSTWLGDRTGPRELADE